MKKLDILWGYFLGLILTLVLIWGYKTNQSDKKLLKDKGQKTRGLIIEVVDRKRGIDFKYRFQAGNLIYESWGNTYEDIYIGDSMALLYYPGDPNISRPLIETK